MTEWITDRQPTKADEDHHGEVCMMVFPGERTSSGGQSVALVAAAHVGPGVPWRHTDDWEPPATPEPEPEAPKPAPKPELRVGQVWRSREGRDVTIERVHPGTTHPFDGSDGRLYTSDGRWNYHQASMHDLIKLITDAPADAAQPEPAPATRKVPRLFVGPIHTIGDGWEYVLASDGTMWTRLMRTLRNPRLGYEPAGFEWQQVEPLPDREEPVDA